MCDLYAGSLPQMPASAGTGQAKASRWDSIPVSHITGTKSWISCAASGCISRNLHHNAWWGPKPALQRGTQTSQWWLKHRTTRLPHGFFYISNKILVTLNQQFNLREKGAIQKNKLTSKNNQIVKNQQQPKKWKNNSKTKSPTTQQILDYM